jgi:UDP-N-acetylglucosamine acyltransferase
MRAIKSAFKLIFRSELRLEDALGRIDRELPTSPELAVFVDFIRQSQRGIAR